MTVTANTPFSALLRSATEEQHQEAETSSFMSNMLGGKLGVDAFTRYTEQLWFIYQALESHWDTLRTDPAAGPFIRPELARTAQLELDLAHLSGPNWREGAKPLPATARYAARLDDCGRDWPAGYVAHHYTRYLGDLSGGQVISATAAKQWGLQRKGDGLRFYDFSDISNPAAFKREYRALLDALPLDETEKYRVLDEGKLAFTLNTAVFEDLGTVFT